MIRHRHRAWGLLCAAAGGEPRPGDRSKQSDGAVWLRLASGETHKHHSQEETCTRPDDHRDLHSADTKHTHMTHTRHRRWTAKTRDRQCLDYMDVTFTPEGTVHLKMKIQSSPPPSTLMESQGRFHSLQNISGAKSIKCLRT